MLELMLLICLVILVVLVWKPLRNNVLGALDARAEKIRTDLDEAQRLHEEAKALLAKYQRQLHEGEKLAGDILGQAETQRRRFEEKMRADYDLAVKRRTDLAMERIAQEEARAVQEVRGRAADLAIRATRRLLVEKVGAGEAQRLVQGAIEEVKRKLA
ncbi:MAG TPA: F0F1 ATP synthase subunit B [Geminicoccaceae bacterium]|jgi:F-type H+-transporting ATPase subunit b|nr:F0F1 ATP synthase subunit B [Geminicoccaceae bacterium]